MNTQFWLNKRVAITGGCSFIASHLLERLKECEVEDVVLIDDLSSGKLENIPNEYRSKVIVGDLRDYRFAKESLDSNIDFCVDLASVHGGRAVSGLSSNAVMMTDNYLINTNVLKACVENNIPNYAFTSSACAYDIRRQLNKNEVLRIPETWDEGYSSLYPDEMYGLTKATHERTIRAYVKAGLINATWVRFFTVMGVRMKLSHFILAAIAKSFIRQNPFEVFGEKGIVRNFTPVVDSTNGLVLAMENIYGIANGKVYNIGYEDRLTLEDVLEEIWNYIGWKPENIKYDSSKPVGVYNRVADMTRAKEELGWKPTTTWQKCLHEIIDWYVETNNIEEVKKNLQKDMYSR